MFRDEVYFDIKKSNIELLSLIGVSVIVYFAFLAEQSMSLPILMLVVACYLTYFFQKQTASFYLKLEDHHMHINVDSVKYKILAIERVFSILICITYVDGHRNRKIFIFSDSVSEKDWWTLGILEKSYG